MKEFNLHLVSDSTGETVSSVARAAMVQFDNIHAVEHLWTLVRTKTHMERVLQGVMRHPGIIMYTLADASLRDILIKFCKSNGLSCISVLGSVITEVANFLGQQATGHIGRKYLMDDDYFKRVEAINYSLNHDDGQATHNLEEADIVLVGASRSSKSPTSMYLAFRGYKCANVPYVHGVSLPDGLFTLKNPMVVGLVITPERLVEIRRSRLLSIKHDAETDYVDIDRIKEELAESKKIFARNQWPMIDVTRKSVEETAAHIMKLFHDRQDSMEAGSNN